MEDRIEAGTFSTCAGAITGSDITLRYRTPEHITPIIHKLEEAGCQIQIEKGKVHLRANRKLKSSRYQKPYHIQVFQQICNLYLQVL